MIPFGPTVHVLKITLRDVRPPVWRRLVVRSETPLPTFARMLESAMGWGGYHLHLFDVGGVLFGPDDEDFDYTIDEDCGGPHGYANLLAVLADPHHPEHANATAWIPGGIDPKAFDLAATNRRLRPR